MVADFSKFMSILAEPRRRKQRISVDPQNVAWKTDQNKIGQKLLTKMGWSEGKGLGSKEQGVTENIRLKANHTARGLGCEGNNNDTVWMTHHDDFASILANLNKSKKSSAEESNSKRVDSQEKDISKSKHHVRYNKFHRGKDLSSYSDEDKTAILGFPKSKKPKRERKESAEDPKPKVEEAPVAIEEPLPSNTTVSKMSVNEYFAAKMAALRARNNANNQEAGQTPIVEEKIQVDEPKTTKKKKRKNKLENIEANSNEVHSAQEQDVENDVEPDEPKVEKKKRKKQRIEGTDETLSEPKKHKNRN